ncbi:methylglutaconyl-CoA hydratase, mitochondrial [Neocloeon triangulifer]|uniref:methylglutaconyl-CoA hydratase, mitochondrial n=1 Tax=Neocloeon triangulifer TaxID=2078957 RepID=UPI00286F3812|nr:methylglutaconyl-CoA hydratase, mitochondrial [Neocloeon triangulifer]XP_059477745.1 methylglutaconyl-CoA hydratase, mitochondrial [Neocloeon triangulifer]
MIALQSLRNAAPLRRPLTLAATQGSRLFSEKAPSDPIIIDRLENEHKGIVVIGMNRPEAKNAFGKSFVQKFTDTVKIIKHDQDTRILIIRSLVPGVFCAGADLKERATMSDKEVVEFVNRLRKLTISIERLPMPVIAALDGAALGGGLELALACDLRVASSNAKLGLVESRLAIIPGAGGTQRLPRLVGASLAKELLFTGRIFDGKKAREYGVVNHAVEQNETKDAAFKRAMELAEEILPSGPIALNLIKTAVDVGMQSDIGSGYKIEEECYSHVVPTKDRIEGLLAFKEKRAPRFKGE